MDGTKSGAEILCVGEILWDSLPAGLFLGGAPLNVARHLCRLGVRTNIASRVGDDRLGEEAVERIGREGVGIDLIQVDSALPTGFVRVALDERSVPEFEIVRPVAWDAIELTDALLQDADSARMIVFGSLAQRSLITHYTIERLWDAEAVKVFDVNLRPPFLEPETIRRSLLAADIVKLNEQELAQIGRWCGLRGDAEEAAAALAAEFGCELVCVTRGEEGAALWHRGGWTEHPGFAVRVRDTVGAGDAFLAALLAGLLAGRTDAELLARANLLGAWVATQDGAVPPYDEAAVCAIAEHRAREIRTPTGSASRTPLG